MKKIGRRALLFILFGVIVIGLGIAITSLFMQRNLTNITPPPAPTAVTEKVLVTTRGLAAGSVLTPSDLTLRDIPIELVPISRLTDPVQAIGKITTVSMVAGEQVLPHHLLDATNVIDRNLAFTLEDDQVLLAFPITDLMSNLNILKRGDLVDILVSIKQTIKSDDPLTLEEDPVERLYTFNSMQRVNITAVIVDILDEAAAQEPAAQATPGAQAIPQAPPEPSRANSVPIALMLALNPQDALVLKHLKDSGATFDIVLRSPNSTQLFDLVPVTSEYLTDLYGLQIPK